MMERCRVCGNTDVFLQYKGAQVGVYCKNCGKWIKWLSKKDQAAYLSKGVRPLAETDEVVLQGFNTRESVAKGYQISGMGNMPPVPKNMGVVLSPEEEQIIAEIDKELERREQEKNNISANPEAFGNDPRMMQQNNMPNLEVVIEKEVERRMAIRLKEMEESNEAVRNTDYGVEPLDYCPVCDGSPLQSDSFNSVQVSIFSGMLSVVSEDGTQILGLYKVKRCPNCGRPFAEK